MKRVLHAILLFVAIAGAFSASGGCGKPGATASASHRPVIVVTIFPLFSLVQQLSGDVAEVSLLMPPGSSPHDFELQPAQMEPLSRADLLVAVGANLDLWAEKSAGQVGRKDLQILRMSELLAAGPSTKPANPHLWMNVAFAESLVLALAHQLDERFPELREKLDARATSIVEELSELDEASRRALADVPNKQLVAYHNAYDPLAERYGLHVVAHLADIDLSPGGEVTPQNLVQTIEAIRRHHLRVIYSEPQFPGRAAEMLRQQTGVKVMSLDDLGGPSIAGYDTYQSLIRSDVQTLKAGQSLTGDAGASAPAGGPATASSPEPK